MSKQKYLIIGCGSLGQTTALELAQKGVEADLITLDDAKERGMTINRIDELEKPFILTNIRPIDLEQPQNRAERRKKARAKNKGK